MAAIKNKEVIIDELVEGYDPCELFGITIDTTDSEIFTIADEVMAFAENNSYTLIQSDAFAKDILDEVQNYCLGCRNDLQRMIAENTKSAKIEAELEAQRVLDKQEKEA